MATLTIYTLLQGFLLCASMIIAVGPQNLFILRQGLRRQHLFATALFSVLADVVLIAVGVGGIGSLISTNSQFQTVIGIGGTLFLIGYGARSLLLAYRADATPDPATVAPINIKASVIAALSFSLLNPLAYVDTFVIIGSKSLAFPVDQRLVFGIGAVMASAVWFFTLTYGASKLTPLLRSRTAWRVLDVVSGCMMLVVAGTMLVSCGLFV